MVQRSNRIILSSLATQWPILSRPDFSIGVRSLRRNLFSFDIYICVSYSMWLYSTSEGTSSQVTSGWPAVVKVEEKLIVERCFHREKLCREINFREKETRSVLLIDRERIYLFVQFPRSIAIRPRITHTGIRDTVSLYCPRGMRVPLSRFVSNLSIFMTRRISRRVVERVVLSCSARVIKERKIAHDEQISSSFMLDERAARYTHVWKGKELSLAEE